MSHRKVTAANCETSSGYREAILNLELCGIRPQILGSPTRFIMGKRVQGRGLGPKATSSPEGHAGPVRPIGLTANPLRMVTSVSQTCLFVARLDCILLASARQDCLLLTSARQDCLLLISRADLGRYCQPGWLQTDGTDELR